MTPLVHANLLHPFLYSNHCKSSAYEAKPYWFTIADTISESSAANKTFHCWAEKDPFRPSPFISQDRQRERVCVRVCVCVCSLSLSLFCNINVAKNHQSGLTRRGERVRDATFVQGKYPTPTNPRILIQTKFIPPSWFYV